MVKIKKMINFKYIGYNLLKTDYNKLNQYIKELSQVKKVSKFSIYYDLLKCLFLYDTRLLDYFYFRFFKDSTDRKIHTNVWDMHLFHRKFNSNKSIIFRDKILFREKFNSYFNYPYFKLTCTEDINLLIRWIIDNKLENIVAKEPLGTVGKGVMVIKIDTSQNRLSVNGEPLDKFIHKIYKNGFTLFESFIEQHKTLAKIYPKSINTIRIVTFLNDNNVEIWGALLRMGWDKSVDNFDAGGLSAKVNLSNGLVEKGAIVKYPFDNNIYDKHPITNESIKGVIIPNWAEVIKLIQNAALEVKDVRTVGWDVALTVNGPTLIEGNDNWDKTHFELTSEIGLNERIKDLLKK